MGSVKTTLQIDVLTKTPFEAKAKLQALKQLATMDVDVLEKLAELSKNPKAIAVFRNPPLIAKSFLGL